MRRGEAEGGGGHIMNSNVSTIYSGTDNYS